MYPLLIIREEIVCLIILVFLLLNARVYRMGKDSRSFINLAVFAICHVVLDIVTVITVNRRDAMPLWVNDVLHIFFYAFAILFTYEFFCYIGDLTLSPMAAKRLRRVELVPPVLYLCVLPWLPIVYLSGNGTDYSYGPAAFAGYGLTMMYFLSSVVLLAMNHKKLDRHVKFALYPMLLAMVVAEVVQIVVPELLFTGGASTVVTMGFFFSLENPATVFQQKVQVDALTGVRSRQRYESDIEEIDYAYSKDGGNYCVVFCDVNRLRAVNNLYGHMEGDSYISNVALILQQEMRRSLGVYRMGGDEFLILYKDCSENTVKNEIAAVRRRCEELSEEKGYLADVAMGYAFTGEQYHSIRDVLKVADYRMYQNKAEIKMQKAYSEATGDSSLNVVGLDDRIFEALSISDGRSCLFVTNLDTNVTRLTPAWVELFDLPGEYIYDFAHCWTEKIHPGDREIFLESIQEMMSGKRRTHDTEYRAMDRSGEYVLCTCRGSICDGKNGEPPLFAGTLINHGAESI